MIAALALVLGLSQCKKQENPAASGEKQHIVLTAGHSDNGAKISGDFTDKLMSLKWEVGDVITVSGALKGTLDEITIDPSDPSRATFTGTVEEGEGTTVTFSYGEQPGPDDPLYCDGTLDGGDGIKAKIRNSYLTYTTEVTTSGEYSAEFKLPFAVLKVDVSAIISDVWTMPIKSGDKFLAMVNVTPETSHELYLGIPVAEDAGKVEYTFCGPDQQVTKTWDLEPGVFYTKSDGHDGSTGEAIVIAPEAPQTRPVRFNFSNLDEFPFDDPVINLYYNGATSPSYSKLLSGFSDSFEVTLEVGTTVTIERVGATSIFYSVCIEYSDTENVFIIDLPFSDLPQTFTVEAEG